MKYLNKIQKKTNTAKNISTVKGSLMIIFDQYVESWYQLGEKNS